MYKLDKYFKKLESKGKIFDLDYSARYYNTHYLSSYSVLTSDFKYVYVLLSDFRGKKEYSIYTNTNTDVRADRKLSSQKQVINYLNKLL